MTRILSILIVMLTIGCTPLQTFAAPKDAPAVEVEAPSHDFGTIREDGGPVSHTFTIKNTGTSPLIILTASSSCGCTKPKFSPAPIKPGESGSVTVTYLPEGRPGEFKKAVKLTTNAPKKKVTLHISGTVIPKD